MSKKSLKNEAEDHNGHTADDDICFLESFLQDFENILETELRPIQLNWDMF